MNERKYDVIMALPFGSITGEGSANWNIAEQAVALAKELRIPLFAHVRLPVKTVATKIPAHERELMPPIELIDGRTVLSIANNFVDVIGREQWRNVLLVSMPYVADRCIRDIERLTEDRFVVEQEPELEKLDGFAWFNKKDRQRLVRSPVLWHFAELALVALPWSMYQKVASR